MNTQWAQVAVLKPRLREAVSVHRHRYRGQRWYLLRNGINGSWQRINESAWRLVRRLDGHHDLATAQTASDVELSEQEALAILDALNRAELLDWGFAESSAAMMARAAEVARRKRLARLLSPFSLRLRLFDPDALLERQSALSAQIFSAFGLAVAVLLIAAAGLVAASAWPHIGGYWQARGYTAHQLLLIPAVYLVIKLVHEWAHASAARRWGAEVHEMGVVLLLLMPIPYVDASAAWAFPEKHRRMVVGAAGILAELVLASLAVFAFVLVEGGIVKDLAYTTMLLASVSTLLFNGNPLLRFDGYYVLSDLIEIPNLAARSTRYWVYLLQRYLLGIATVRSPVTAHGERAWFVIFGASASLYRIVVVFGIALFVAGALPLLGIALASWALLAQFGLPLARCVRFLVNGAPLAGRRARALAVSGAGLAALLAMLLAVPLPLSTRAEGVVWLPERAHIRAGADGTVSALLTTTNLPVSAGSALLQIDNPLLGTRIAALEWELREIEARRDAARQRDRVDTRTLNETRERLQADLAALRAEAAQLVVTSPVDGTVVIPQSTHLEGRYVRQGEVLGYVLEDRPAIVRAAVSQADIGMLRRGVRATAVRLSERPRHSVDATISRETPSATVRLPSAALGATAGGSIAVDPTDTSGLTAREGIYLVDLTLADETVPAHVGGRAHVRFEHSPEPVGWRLYRALRQLLLSRLAV